MKWTDAAVYVLIQKEVNLQD